ncbi:MAG: ABC transporter ATP-binding protein [Betaproteobacteria bacterium]|nr:ABC transporter ATP-binding protein [Betaproteobacteria bacterium]NCX72940.1 ABC transporter ATP-binding protein [Betaproteobacteria bacterium]
MGGLSLTNATVAGRLHNLSLKVMPGEVWGLIGPNGSGKSSLLHTLAGLLPSTGRLRLGDQDLHAMPARERARQVGLLPQHNHSAWSLNVHDLVSLGRLPWLDEDSDAIDHAMELAGVRAFAHMRVDHLSGGQQARVWLARVFAGCPQVLLADEPVASLDLLYQQQISQALRNYARQGKAVVVALHDLSLAARCCDRLALMDQGRLIASGLVSQVLDPDLLSRVYGLEVMVDLASSPPIVLAR